MTTFHWQTFCTVCVMTICEVCDGTGEICSECRKPWDKCACDERHPVEWCPRCHGPGQYVDEEDD